MIKRVLSILSFPHKRESSVNDSKHMSYMTRRRAFWIPACAGMTMLLLYSSVFAGSSLDSNIMPSGGLDSNVAPASGLDVNQTPKHSLDSNVMPKRGLDSERMPKSGIDSEAVGSGDVDQALCRALTKHTPDANVAYQPGTDVHGKAVAPADLPGQAQMQLPSKIDIPLTLNLAKVMHLNTNSYPYNQLGTGTEAQLGTLSVEGDKVTFNGQPLSDTQQDNLAVLCMKANK